MSLTATKSPRYKPPPLLYHSTTSSATASSKNSTASSSTNETRTDAETTASSRSTPPTSPAPINNHTRSRPILPALYLHPNPIPRTAPLLAYQNAPAFRRASAVNPWNADRIGLSTLMMAVRWVEFGKAGGPAEEREERSDDETDDWGVGDDSGEENEQVGESVAERVKRRRSLWKP